MYMTTVKMKLISSSKEHIIKEMYIGGNGENKESTLKLIYKNQQQEKIRGTTGTVVRRSSTILSIFNYLNSTTRTL